MQMLQEFWLKYFQHRPVVVHRPLHFRENIKEINDEIFQPLNNKIAWSFSTTGAMVKSEDKTRK